MNDPHCKVLN
jgi:hypothetical protein